MLHACIAFTSFHLNLYSPAHRPLSCALPGTRITFVTEGILLRALASDPLLNQYDVAIIDEVHERHLNTDFLLALLRALMLRRPTFRIVLMSATINQAAYSAYFGGAPVVQARPRAVIVNNFCNCQHYRVRVRQCGLLLTRN